VVELDDKNLTRITREELRLLRETSGRVEKLVERNEFLSDELERWKEVSSRVKGLENENKRLTHELAQKLKQQQQKLLGTPKSHLPVVGAGAKSTTPVPSDPRSSTAENKAVESKTMVAWEKHQTLINKFNKLWDHYLDLKDARQKIEDAWRAEKEKAKTQEALAKEQENTISKKNDKIQKLEEENQRLCARQNEERTLGLPTIPLLRSDGHDADEYRREITPAVQVPASNLSMISPVRASRNEPGNTAPSSKCTEIPTHQESPGPEEPELPAYHRAADMRVEDTQFEPIESYHTSSTEGSDLLSPSRAAGHEQTPVNKPTAERSSSPSIEFISARSVQKRKTTHGCQTIKTEVKIETISSSPIGLAQLQYLNPNESLDLDDIGEKVDTPKKQRRVIELTHQASRPASLSPLVTRLRGDRESQSYISSAEDEVPGSASQETPVLHRDSILKPRSTNRQVLPRTSDDRARKKRRITSDEAVGELVEDGEIGVIAEKLRKSTTNANCRLDRLLAKPSLSKQILSPRLAHAGDQQPRLARTPLTSGLATEIQHPPKDAYDRNIESRIERFREYSPPTMRLGQDSEAISGPSFKGSSNKSSAEPILPSSRTSLRNSTGRSRPTSKSTSRGSAEPPRQTSGDILRGLAALPKASLVPITYLPSKRPHLITHSAKATPRTPTGTTRLIPQESPEFNKTAPAKSCLSRDDDASDWKIDSDQPPLRARSISRLKLSDFKINSNYNQGYDYAFNEVVRGQEARQCLQGCTKAECCGRKFRVLAEMHREAAGIPTLSQEQADEMLLDEYLGDNAYKIRGLSKEEKEELILQAKARDMANKFGRHRQAYERRASPPGFWRADFPTTQEVSDDCEKAHEMARSAIEERYKEAMRSNGRFIFRDE
jgi:DNA repair protein endonuclease SAE2/CtIP C-terminus